MNKQEHFKLYYLMKGGEGAKPLVRIGQGIPVIRYICNKSHSIAKWLKSFVIYDSTGKKKIEASELGC